MNIKVKKIHEKGIVRVEALGEIKEILFSEDFKDSGAKISLFFRGEKSSGIVELNSKEATDIADEISKRISLLKKPKIIKFKK